MENLMMFGKPKEVEEKKSSIFKEYVLPIGALVIPTISFLAQNNSPWWGSLAIAVYVVIVLIFLVVPAIKHALKNLAADSKRMRSESADWVQQYVTFCREAYQQFEDLLRNGQLDDTNIREVKKAWNHARDEYNQTVTNWKNLCLEINSSFGQNICNAYYETLKTLE
jgi:hypothetical protein